MTEDLILIAVIRKPHGVRGEVAIESFSFDNDRFKLLKTILVRKKGESTAQLLTVTALKNTSKGMLFTFKEIADRNEAELYRNAELLVPGGERLALPKGLAYLDEYPGMKVFDDATNEQIAVVKDLIEMPAGNILVLELTDTTERLLTMSGNEIVDVDREARTIRVQLLEELNGGSKDT